MDGEDELDPLQLIDFEKYLKCPQCRAIEFYCAEHKIEVEKTLGKNFS